MASYTGLKFENMLKKINNILAIIIKIIIILLLLFPLIWLTIIFIGALLGIKYDI